MKFTWAEYWSEWPIPSPGDLQSMDFSWPGYWSAYPLPSPCDLPNPGIQPRSLTVQADSLPAEPQGKPLKNNFIYLFLDALDLCCCSSLSLVVASRGYSVAAMRGLLIVVASLVKHGP